MGPCAHVLVLVIYTNTMNISLQLGQYIVIYNSLLFANWIFIMSTKSPTNQQLLAHNMSIFPDLLGRRLLVKYSWNELLAKLDSQQVNFNERYDHELGSQLVSTGINHVASFHFCQLVIFYALMQGYHNGRILNHKSSLFTAQQHMANFIKDRLDTLSAALEQNNKEPLPADLDMNYIQEMLWDNDLIPVSDLQLQILKMIMEEGVKKFDYDHQYYISAASLFFYKDFKFGEDLPYALSGSLISNHLRLLLPQVYLTLRELTYYYPNDCYLLYLCAQASIFLGYDQSALSYLRALINCYTKTGDFPLESNDSASLVHNFYNLMSLSLQLNTMDKGGYNNRNFFIRPACVDYSSDNFDEYDPSSLDEDSDGMDHVDNEELFNHVFDVLHKSGISSEEILKHYGSIQDKVAEFGKQYRKRIAGFELDTLSRHLQYVADIDAQNLSAALLNAKQAEAQSIAVLSQALLQGKGDTDDNKPLSAMMLKNIVSTTRANVAERGVAAISDLNGASVQDIYAQTKGKGGKNSASLKKYEKKLSAAIQREAFSYHFKERDASNSQHTSSFVEQRRADSAKLQARYQEAMSYLSQDGEKLLQEFAEDPWALSTDGQGLSPYGNTIYVSYDQYSKQQEMQRYFLQNCNFSQTRPFSTLYKQSSRDLVSLKFLFSAQDCTNWQEDVLDIDYDLPTDEKPTFINPVLTAGVDLNINAEDREDFLSSIGNLYDWIKAAKMKGDYDIYSDIMAIPLQEFIIRCNKNYSMLPMPEVELQMMQGPVFGLETLYAQYQQQHAPEHSGSSQTAAEPADAEYADAAAEYDPSAKFDAAVKAAVKAVEKAANDYYSKTADAMINDIHQLKETAGDPYFDDILKVTDIHKFIRQLIKAQGQESLDHAFSEQAELMLQLSHSPYLFNHEIKVPFLEHLLHLPKKWAHFSGEFAQALQSFSSRMSNPMWQGLQAQFSLGFEHMATSFFYELLYTPFLTKFKKPEFNGYSPIDVDYVRMVDQSKSYPLWSFGDDGAHELYLFSHLQALEPPVQSWVLRYVQDFIRNNQKSMPDLHLKSDPLLTVQDSLLAGSLSFDLNGLQLFVGSHLSAEQEALLDKYAQKDRYFKERYWDNAAAQWDNFSNSTNAKCRAEVLAFGKQALDLFAGGELAFNFDDSIQKCMVAFAEQPQLQRNAQSHYQVMQKYPRLTLVVYGPNLRALEDEFHLQNHIRHYLQALVGPAYFFYFVKEIYYISLPEAWAAFRSMSLPFLTVEASLEKDAFNTMQQAAQRDLKRLTHAQRQLQQRINTEATTAANNARKFGGGVGERQENWAQFHTQHFFVYLPLNQWPELVRCIKPQDMLLDDVYYPVAYTSSIQCNVHKIVETMSNSKGRKLLMSFVEGNKNKGGNKNKKKKNKAKSKALESLAVMNRSFVDGSDEDFKWHQRFYLWGGSNEGLSAGANANVSATDMANVADRSDVICGVSTCYALSRQLSSELLYPGSLGNSEYLQALGIKAQSLVLNGNDAELEAERDNDTFKLLPQKLLLLAQGLEEYISQHAPYSVSVIGYAYGSENSYIDLIFWDQVKGYKAVAKYMQAQKIMQVQRCFLQNM